MNFDFVFFFANFESENFGVEKSGRAVSKAGAEDMLRAYSSMGIKISVVLDVGRDSSAEV